MAKIGLTKTVFRKIRGRIVPVKVSSQNTRNIIGQADSAVRMKRKGSSLEFQTFRKGKRTGESLRMHEQKGRIIKFNSKALGSFNVGETHAVLRRIKAEKKRFSDKALGKFKKFLKGFSNG